MENYSIDRFSDLLSLLTMQSSHSFLPSEKSPYKYHPVLFWTTSENKIEYRVDLTEIDDLRGDLTLLFMKLKIRLYVFSSFLSQCLGMHGQRIEIVNCCKTKKGGGGPDTLHQEHSSSLGAEKSQVFHVRNSPQSQTSYRDPGLNFLLSLRSNTVKTRFILQD